MSRLSDKSVHELRAIYAALGFHDGFVLDKNHLIQNIEAHQKSLVPEPEPVIPPPEYDARLMNKPPAKRSDKDMLDELLAPYIAMGLRVTYPHPEQWHMEHGKREDSGSIRQRPAAILRCAQRLMK